VVPGLKGCYKDKVFLGVFRHSLYVISFSALVIPQPIEGCAWLLGNLRKPRLSNDEVIESFRTGLKMVLEEYQSGFSPEALTMNGDSLLHHKSNLQRLQDSYERVENALNILSKRRLRDPSRVKTLIATILDRIVYSDSFAVTLRVLVKTDRISEADVEAFDRIIRKTFQKLFRQMGPLRKFNLKDVVQLFKAHFSKRQDLRWTQSYALYIIKLRYTEGANHPLFKQWVHYRKTHKAKVKGLKKAWGALDLKGAIIDQAENKEPVEPSVEKPKPNSVVPTTSLMQVVGIDERDFSEGKKALTQNQLGRKGGRFSKTDPDQPPKARYEELMKKVAQDKGRGEIRSKHKKQSDLTPEKKAAINRKMGGRE